MLNPFNTHTHNPTMTSHELAADLLKSPDLPIMILDGFNGGGYPREINLGPIPHTITGDDVKESGDCEEFEVGTEILTMGYGCY
jgi:hypothetical protein